LNCVHCGAELPDREEICTLCGKPTKVPDTPEALADPTAAASKETVMSPTAPAVTPLEPPKDSSKGAAFCSECKKFVYLDTNGCCAQGHPVSSMSPRGEQTPGSTVRPDAGYMGQSNTEGMFANNSGMGVVSSLPAELQGPNWGGFLLTWIWGIGNSVWISLLSFVPIVSYIMPFVLLFKGNEWAWRNKRWDSVDHFLSVQRKWAIAGLVYFVFVLLLVCAIVFSIALPAAMQNN
jgi:hypothetical protein